MNFTAHGYKSVTNLGGYEVEISLSNDSARFRLFGEEVTDWSEIEFEEDGRAYCDTCVGRQYLDEYMRY